MMFAPGKAGVATMILGLMADGSGQASGGFTFDQQIVLVSITAILGGGAGSVLLIVREFRKRGEDKTPASTPDDPTWHIDPSYVRVLEEDRRDLSERLRAANRRIRELEKGTPQ